MKAAKPITAELIQRFKENYDQDKIAKVFTAALSKADIADAAYSPMDAAKLENTFSIDLHGSKATNQQASGRCWLFASMNVMREIIAKSATWSAWNCPATISLSGINLRRSTTVWSL